VDVFSLTCAELAEEFGRRYGKGLFHAAALFREIFKNGSETFAHAPEFAASIALAGKIAADMELPSCRIHSRIDDGEVVKFATALSDDCLVESVIIPASGRTTLCVSSQVGCRMGCKFCVTGDMGFVRNLTVSEIVWQVWAARFLLHYPVDNIVFMGMGEPLDNLDNVIQAVRVIIDQRGFSIPPSHVSISTAGHVDGLQRLAGIRPAKLRLAVSLNAVTDDLRDRLMPINRRYPLAQLKSALMDFPASKRDFILIGYVLLPGVNDSAEDADRLAGFVEGLPVRVNLIGYNGVDGSPFTTPDDAEMTAFRDRLVERNIFVRIRQSRGRNVMAACGQLGAELGKRMLSAVLCILVILGILFLKPCHAQEQMDALTAAMSEYLVCFPLELMGMEKQELAVTSKSFCLAAVYHPEDLRPYWVTPDGPGPKASIVLDFLAKAETEGLDPRNYEVDKISALFSALFSARQPRDLAELDTLLTFNLIKYIHDVSRGQIKPRFADPALFPEAGDVNFEPQTTLEKALGAPDLAVYLEGLPPAHSHYMGLKKALKTYREIEKNGGWSSIPAGKTIRPGDHDERLPAVIHHLSVTGDLDPVVAQTGHYSLLLKQSVMRIQGRHGLFPDGVIGPKTFAALNATVADRIKQIIINMTRWRWQEHDLGETYVLVNIANFDLTAFEGGQEAFRIPVIVGKFQQQTPIFSDRIAYVDINPYWNIPPTIARNEELPKLRKDPDYLVNRHVRLFSGWNADARELDSRSIDWRHVSPARMGQYSLRQDPGPWNALGRIKFVFPNKYDVYLHDTPAQNLFSRNQRDFSHGCIRVSDPVKLAAFVLSRHTGGWTPEKISARISENKRVVITLPEPLPVHLTYQTSWVDKNGRICFNGDIYGRDQKLIRALYNH